MCTNALRCHCLILRSVDTNAYRMLVNWYLSSRLRVKCLSSPDAFFQCPVTVNDGLREQVISRNETVVSSSAVVLLLHVPSIVQILEEQ